MALFHVNECTGLSWYLSHRCRGGPVFKHILVPVTGDDADAAAFAVEHQFSSRLQFYMCNRAVAAAQPFLDIAGQVIILHVDEDARDHRQSRERLRSALCWHNPHTTVQRLKGVRHAVATVLVAAAARADMLVMGGYGRSRLREVILAGFTRRVLHGADLKILMAH
jgi:nucleotide-binding universal stress UspA family protein